MAPDTLDAGFREQPFHLILKFLAYEIVFHHGDDQDFLELWIEFPRVNPRVNDFRAGKQWGDYRAKKSKYEKEKMYPDAVGPCARRN